MNQRFSFGLRPWYLHPAMIFYTTWLGVWFLYSLHLSNLLIFPSDTLAAVEVPLLLGFLPFVIIPHVLPRRTPTHTPSVQSAEFNSVLRQRLRVAFRAWVCISTVEIIASGGVPLWWTLTGSSKNYFMFGIPTLHGFMNALILTISITRFALGILDGRKKDLFFPLFTVAWSIVVVTRQMAIVIFVECALIFLMYHRLKFRTVVRAIAVPVIVVVFFGVLGDIRSGAENFRALAQATDQYPAWLPSGFLWTYMYVTTPLNNLVNTFATVRPIGDFTMPNTFSALIPTATRKLLGLSIDNSTWQGNLITEAFNVTTAYAGPLQDLGIAGIVAFSGFVGFLSEMFWLKRGLRNDLIYAVLGQCLFLTIFANHFLALPIIFQVVWCYFLFGRSIRVVPSSSPAVSAYGT